LIAGERGSEVHVFEAMVTNPVHTLYTRSMPRHTELGLTSLSVKGMQSEKHMQSEKDSRRTFNSELFIGKTRIGHYHKHRNEQM